MEKQSGLFGKIFSMNHCMAILYATKSRYLYQTTRAHIKYYAWLYPCYVDVYVNKSTSKFFAVNFVIIMLLFFYSNLGLTLV